MYDCMTDFVVGGCACACSQVEIQLERQRYFQDRVTQDEKELRAEDEKKFAAGAVRPRLVVEDLDDTRLLVRSV
jgi:hypothetical protein